MAHTDLQRVAKRLLDVVLALLLLIATAPVLVPAAALVRLVLGAPVLFVQERTGRSLRRFRIYKLRTMTDERDADGRLLPAGERCHPLGRLLRRLSIDELPQLVNVLRGDLSLVGPRPLVPQYDAWYSQRELLRFSVRPGLTGLAQINGRNDLSWDERLEYDVQYAIRWSLRLDLRILARTAATVLTGSGVLANPSAQVDFDAERRALLARGERPNLPRIAERVMR